MHIGNPSVTSGEPTSVVFVHEHHRYVETDDFALELHINTLTAYGGRQRFNKCRLQIAGQH